MRLHRYSTAQAVAEACAAHILEQLKRAISSNSRAWFAISGGSSPRPMFEIFGRAPFAWDQVQLFWVDERVVPPTDPQSNYKLAFDAWLKPCHFPTANIHRVETEPGAQEAAQRYVEEIRKTFNLAPGEMPQFDVIHRGMGPDGHTASLFPGEPLIADRTGLAAAVWAETMKQWRVTLLPGVLEAGRNTVMQVVGADKAGALKETIEGEYRPSEFPAQIASLGGAADWFVDQPAAASLKSKS